MPLLAQPARDAAGPSARRVNALFGALPTATRYLEIGVQRGHTLQHVTAPTRVGVEPHPRFRTDHLPAGVTIEVCTSDDYFEHTTADTRFDVVFLDGLHTFDQTYRDLINAFGLCPSGVVLIDDVIPSDRFSAIADEDESNAQRKRAGLNDNMWHGDVFKVVLCLDEHHPEIEFRTIVGSDNPQTVAWLRDAAVQPRAVDRARLEHLERLDFSNVFADGTPTAFAPSTESEALADAIAAVSSRFGRDASDTIFEGL